MIILYISINNNKYEDVMNNSNDEEMIEDGWATLKEFLFCMGDI